MVAEMKPASDFSGCCFQKDTIRKVFFDYTRTYSLHEPPAMKRPRRFKTTPKSQTDSKNLFFHEESESCRAMTKVSKSLSLFRASVPWANFGVPLEPQLILEH